MEFTQNWVGYLDRSYEQIKASLLSKFPTAIPEVTDLSETNPMVVLVSFFAGMGEMLNYYIDNMGREAFIGTARQFESLIKLAELIGYAPKASTPSSVDLLFTLTGSSGEPDTHTLPIILPKGTIYQTSNGIPFIQTRDVTLLANTSYTLVPVLQAEDYSQALGTSTGLANQVFNLPSTYAHNTSSIIIDGVAWLRVNNKAQLVDANFKGYYISVDEEQAIRLYFGDGINGSIPITGKTIEFYCKITQGKSGNVLPGAITEVASSTPLVLPTGKSFTILNPISAVGGTDTETTEDLRKNAPMSLRTLDRAVTYQDYIDIARMEREVLTAEVKYCCGKYVEVYVIPKDKSILSSYLVEKLTEVYNCKKMITTKVEVIPAGISRVFLNMNIILKPLVDATTARPTVLTLLNNKFGVSAAKINGKLFLSDIINVLENNPYVESVEISSTQIEPYVKARKLSTFPLAITFTSLPVTATLVQYSIIYVQSTNSFQILRNGYIQDNSLAIGATFNDGIVAFTIAAGTYIDNDVWSFVAHPSYPAIFPSNQLVPTDYSAFIIDVAPETDYIFSTITFTTQGQSSSCLPPC